MHNRIHPRFWTLLKSMDALPGDSPMNTPGIFTRLEIVLAPDGRVVKMGVVATSGVTGFDIGALDTLQRASPFGAVPAAILSSDGQVYVHWEIHRDPAIGCSTMNVRPFILAIPAPDPPKESTRYTP